MATPTIDSKDPQPPQEQKPAEASGSKSQFYGYLYEKDKSPSLVLDALLRSIGKHIVSALPCLVVFATEP
jgi:hypothetical protein